METGVTPDNRSRGRASQGSDYKGAIDTKKVPSSPKGRFSKGSSVHPSQSEKSCPLFLDRVFDLSTKTV